jgi:hypothetical protein
VSVFPTINPGVLSIPNGITAVSEYVSATLPTGTNYSVACSPLVMQSVGVAALNAVINIIPNVTLITVQCYPQGLTNTRQLAQTYGVRKLYSSVNYVAVLGVPSSFSASTVNQLMGLSTSYYAAVSSALATASGKTTSSFTVFYAQPIVGNAISGDANTLSNGAIAGGIVGGISCFAFIVVVIYLRRKNA